MLASAKNGRPRSTATSHYSRVPELNETAVVAVLGMGVVFFFLALLSGLMFLAKSSVDRRHIAGPTGTAGAAASVRARAPLASEPSPRFVAAAVAAYLSAEGGSDGAVTDGAVTARPWRPAPRLG